MNLTDLEPTLLPHTASVLPTVNREPGTLNHPKIQPGSQDFAAGGEIELAYHRIRPPAAELNRSQHVELLPVTVHTITTNTRDTWQAYFTSPDSMNPKAIYAQGTYLNQQEYSLRV